MININQKSDRESLTFDYYELSSTENFYGLRLTKLDNKNVKLVKANLIGVLNTNIRLWISTKDENPVNGAIRLETGEYEIQLCEVTILPGNQITLYRTLGYADTCLVKDSCIKNRYVYEYIPQVKVYEYDSCITECTLWQELKFTSWNVWNTPWNTCIKY